MHSLLSHQLKGGINIDEGTITNPLGVTSMIGDVSTLATTI
jgi:hypothetical protein